jgi:hypothetical protein
MAIPFTAEINPRGATPEQKQADLISQLRVQNRQLNIIIQDLYREIDMIKKGELKK